VCKCVLYYCHRVSTQLQFTNISYHIILYHIIYHTISYHVMSYIITYHIISCHVMSYIITYHIRSCHVMSYHIICHIISMDSMNTIRYCEELPGGRRITNERGLILWNSDAKDIMLLRRKKMCSTAGYEEVTSSLVSCI
jgi:hypothetical protein